MVSALILCLAAVGVDDPPKSPEYLAGYAKGRAEAERELAEGRATIYSGELVHTNVDLETGLMFTRQGCEFDDSLRGVMRGHNDRIDEYIARHGNPSGSYAPWLKELRDLKGYFASERAAGRIVRLDLDAPPAKSPDGVLSLGLHKATAKEGEAGRWMELRSSPGGVSQTIPFGMVKNDVRSVEFAWGPKGSNLGFVRWDHDINEGYPGPWVAAVDLKVGRYLRHELERRPRPVTGSH